MASRKRKGVNLRILILTAMIIGSVCSGANAQTAGLKGAGAMPCAKLGSVFQPNHSTMDGLYYSWALGYWSGMNVGVSIAAKRYKDLQAKSANELQREIRQFCA
jgi:hypothetical protein